jgi:glycosyltransferase involved in cell wall biosynthesis
MAEPVWFWQRIVSPHMAALAKALAAQNRDVVYVAERAMSADRAQMGWTEPDLGGAVLHVAPDACAARALAISAPRDSIHICQGLRGNGVVGAASGVLARRSLRCWIIMETVDNRGWKGWLRRLEYRRLVLMNRRRLEGILATGHETLDWLVARGMPRARVFPFTYFLSQPIVAEYPEPNSRPFQVIFVGQLIKRKGVDLLIDAMAALEPGSAQLTILGSGPLEAKLRTLSKSSGLSVRWLGTVPITEVPRYMAQADCLVLPSRHDGWGAVASEAIMVGTPVICSDACGAAAVVQASGKGQIFASGDARALQAALALLIERGPLRNSSRSKLAQWAACLQAKAGAEYLSAILHFGDASGARPPAPWESAREPECC